MKTIAMVALVVAAAATLAGCASDGDGYGAAYYQPTYYGAYYDGYYGPFDGGYWGPDDSTFYFYDGHGYRADHDGHFRHDPHMGFHHLHWREGGGGFHPDHDHGHGH